MERAGYWFHEITPPPKAAPPVTTEPAPPVAASANPPADQRDFGELTEAEHYALLYPDRAALIRAERGLPPNPSFGPPTPELAEYIVNSNSPILRALDRPPAAATASA